MQGSWEFQLFCSRSFLPRLGAKGSHPAGDPGGHCVRAADLGAQPFRAVPLPFWGRGGGLCCHHRLFNPSFTWALWKSESRAGSPPSLYCCVAHCCLVFCALESVQCAHLPSSCSLFCPSSLSQFLFGSRGGPWGTISQNSRFLLRKPKRYFKF